jgi:hypothetical protein
VGEEGREEGRGDGDFVFVGQRQGMDETRRGREGIRRRKRRKEEEEEVKIVVIRVVFKSP